MAASLARGVLAELPLEQGSRRVSALYLTHADRDLAGPAACRLGEMLAMQASQQKL